jgi:hypothetical protein
VNGLQMYAGRDMSAQTGRDGPESHTLHAITLLLNEREAQQILDQLRSQQDSCHASLKLEQILSSVADGEIEGMIR